MTEDILPAIRTSLGLTLVDGLLNILTHRTPTIRRTPYLILLVLVILFCRLLSGRSPVVMGPSLSLWEDPISQSKEQIRDYRRLRHMITRTKSNWGSNLYPGSESYKDVFKQFGVTAVIVVDKKKKSIQLLLDNLCKRPFVKEIIIWNNNPYDFMNPTDFKILTDYFEVEDPIFRIVNAGENVGEMGRYKGCLMASYSHCLINDPEWMNLYLDSLYYKYIQCCSGEGRGGSRILSSVNSVMFHALQKWRFEQPQIGLHTGFVWIGTGSLFPKSFATRFLDQQATSIGKLKNEQALRADTFFAIWTNTFPDLLLCNLILVDVQEGILNTLEQASGKILELDLLVALQALYRVIVYPSLGYSPYPFFLNQENLETDLRTPVRNDSGLFISNLVPFPPTSFLRWPHIPIHPPSRGVLGWIERLTTQREYETRQSAFDPFVINIRQYMDMWENVPGGWVNLDWWDQEGNWALAMGPPNTCWKSELPFEPGQYFGFSFIQRRAIKSVVFVGSHNLAAMSDSDAVDPDFNGWRIMTERQAGHGWEPRLVTSPPAVSPEQSNDEAFPRFKVAFSLQPKFEQDGSEIEVESIRFVSVNRQRKEVALCEVELDGWAL